MTSLERESDIQYSCTKLLEAVGCVVVSFRSLHSAKKARPKQFRGVPDLKVFAPRQRLAFWLELKRPGEVLSEAQRMFKQIAEQCQEGYVVARSVAELQGYLRLRGVIA